MQAIHFKQPADIADAFRLRNSQQHFGMFCLTI